jgi:recombination protein RecA
MGDSHVGLHARLMSQALRKLTSVISKTNTVVVFINQLREKVGVMYGNPETTTGGKALKFYATIRIDVRKSDPIKNGKEIIGNRTKIKVVKNKVSPPFRNCVVDMLYGEGISRTGEILDFGVEMDLIKKAGAFYSYKEVRIGQGRDNARQYILEHPVIFDELDTAIREKMIATPIPAPVIADNEEAPSEDDVEFVLDDDISEEELEAAV